MTVIAVKDGWMASDSRECWKDRIDSDRCKKIYRMPDGSLYGGAGNTSGIQLLGKTLKNLIISVTKDGKKKQVPFPSQEFKGTQALWLTRAGLYFYEKGSWDLIKYPYAIGTGSDYAIAALDQGCSAIEAIRAAIKRNVYCGGPIQKHKLK